MTNVVQPCSRKDGNSSTVRKKNTLVGFNPLSFERCSNSTITTVLLYAQRTQSCNCVFFFPGLQASNPCFMWPDFASWLFFLAKIASDSVFLQLASCPCTCRGLGFWFNYILFYFAVLSPCVVFCFAFSLFPFLAFFPGVPFVN